MFSQWAGVLIWFSCVAVFLSWAYYQPVSPELVARIEFLEWTDSDHLRHSKFVCGKTKMRGRL
jgi:ATP-dependent DNA ligase